MFVEFNELSDTARVWIYQANRSFTEEEIVEIKEKAQDFITQWTVHGENLRASYELRYKRFLIFALDQEFNVPSGCSIDASVRFIQQLENEYNVDLLDKMNVRSEEHTSELQSRENLVCRLLLEKKKKKK